jgi:hypothetical protein
MNRNHYRNHYQDPCSRATVPAGVAAGAVAISIVPRAELPPARRSSW